MAEWRALPDFEGRHVRLRALAETDRDGLLAAFADNPAKLMTIVPGPATFDQWFAALAADKAAGRAWPYTVLDAKERISGATRYLRMNAGHRRLEIGGTIYARRVQRTGLNTEAKFMLLRHAFEELGCQSVQLRTDFLNRRSRTAIERLGARQDGILRGHMVMPDGRVRDTVAYSILDGEWAGVRRNLEILMAQHDPGAANAGMLDAADPSS